MDKTFKNLSLLFLDLIQKFELISFVSSESDKFSNGSTSVI